MKLSLGKRIVLFFHWLFSLSLLLIVAFMDFTHGYWQQLEDRWGIYATIGAIAYVAVNVLLSAAVIVMTVKRDKRSAHGFIEVDSSETGKIRIAVSAIEQMVKQAVSHVDGISDLKIKIENMDDSVEVNVIVTMFNGAHVPTVTMGMQRAIRQYVEMNCGISVRSVSVSIQAVTPAENAGKKAKRTKEKQARDAASAMTPAVGSEAVFTENVPEALSREIPGETQPEAAEGFAPEAVTEPDAADGMPAFETSEAAAAEPQTADETAYEPLADYDDNFGGYSEPACDAESAEAEPMQEGDCASCEGIELAAFADADEVPQDEEEKKN